MLQQASSDESEVLTVYHIQRSREFHELEELGTTPPPPRCVRSAEGAESARSGGVGSLLRSKL